jgi:hypothetical protein
MIRVYHNRIFIVFNSTVKFLFLSVSKSSIVVKVSLTWFNFNCLCKTNNGLVEVSLAVKTDSFVVVGVGVFRVDADGAGVVLDC